MSGTEKCRVRGCKRDADTTWESEMNLHGAKVPVCSRHRKSDLWWYKGWIFDRAEKGRMNFATVQEWKSTLLRPRLVREDVYIQGLEPDEVEMIREASERGLKPGGFSVEGNTLVLRFDRDESRKPSQEE